MKLSAAGAFFFLVAAVGLLHAGKPSEDRWLQRSKRENISAFEKAAYEQLAKMHLCKFSQHDHRGCFQVIGLEDNQGPTEVIYRMGLDTLPILVEALDDETPTKTVTWDRGGEHPVWKVNELVARLIHWVADRDFEIKVAPADIREPGGRIVKTLPERSLILGSAGRRMGDPQDTLAKFAPQFKKAVLDWYAKNRKKTLAERKIADVSDAWFRNCFDAIEWLGKNRAGEGREAIVKRIDAIFVIKQTEESSLDNSELADCAIALGRIGDRKSALSIRRACKHLSERIEEGLTGSSYLFTLFQAYHGLALEVDPIVWTKKGHSLATLLPVFRTVCASY